MALGLGLGLGLVRGSGVSAPPFAPTDIADLEVWLDSSDADTVKEVSDAVYRWDDKSGNDYHAVQSNGSKQPITNTRTMNGINAIDFDGTAHYLENNSGLYTLTTGASTIFTVLNPENRERSVYGGDGKLNWRLNGGSNRSLFFHHPSTGISIAPWMGTGVDNVIVQARSGGTTKAIQNGADINSFASSGANFTMTSFNIGATSSGGELFDGLICEYVIFSRYLTDDELNTMGNYLASKWGTTWTTIT